ncbi:hypothetical protein GCM10022204_02220 [Microlunatus aurantiacus]|uniref:Uncharacterized protein n=1 Tax=Microlunatus aurantiacus TaxID=446786 RepID=A0ABP7CKY1_9ACTN
MPCAGDEIALVMCAVVAEPRDLHRLANDHPVEGLQATAPSKQDSDLTASGRRDTPDHGGRTYR